MFIFPADDIPPDASYWSFIYMEETNKKDFVLGLKAFETKFEYSDPENRFQEVYPFRPARIRSLGCSGACPETYCALFRLNKGLTEIQNDEKRPPLLWHAPDGDIFIQGNASTGNKSTISANLIKQHKELHQAIEDVWDALRMDTKYILRRWHNFPDSFPLKQNALEEIKCFCKKRALKNEILFS